MAKSSPLSPDLSPTIVTPPPDDDGALVAHLKGAGRWIIDATVTQAARDALCLSENKVRRSLTAVLATRTVLRPHVAEGLVQWAVRHGAVPAQCSWDMQIVLQESLTNAAIHGNCRLPGLKSFDNSYERFLEAIEACLASPELAGLPVVVSLRRLARLSVLHIDDVGPGYSRRDPLVCRDPILPTGRGFMLMQSFSSFLHLSRGGSRLSAGFRHA